MLYGTAEGVEGEVGKSSGSVISFRGRCCGAFFLLPETRAMSLLVRGEWGGRNNGFFSGGIGTVSKEKISHTAAMCATGLSLDCEAILCERTGLQWRCGIS